MWPFPKVVAHRGGGTLAPENTMAALRCGLDHGHHAVEFDVMLARDGVPIVMHDPHLGRTIRGSGSISDYTAGELTAMDAGSWFNKAFAGERVPTYEQFFRFCTDHGIWMNVEIKPVPGFEAETGRVVAEYTRQFLQERHGERWHADPATMPLFSSFSFDAMLAAKAAAPEIPRAMLLRTIPSDWQEKMQRLEAVAMDVSYRELMPGQVSMVKEAGYGIFCYTINDVKLAKELYSWGVNAICTDRIDLIDRDFWK